MSEAEEMNKALVRRYFEAHTEGDLDTMRELLAPDFVDHRPLPGGEPDRESYIQFVAERKAALSDIRFIVEDQIFLSTLHSDERASCCVHISSDS